MRSTVIVYTLFMLFACNNSQISDQAPDNSDSLSKPKENAIDGDFAAHFKTLDSAQAARPGDTTFTCCSSSIKFMEENTGIATSGDGSFVGKLDFSSTDLKKWHAWYAELKERK